MTAHSNGEAAKSLRFELACSYVVKQNIKGVPRDVRRLTVAVFEDSVQRGIRRGLLGSGDLENPWTVVSALFAGMFDDHTIEWLNRRGYLRWDERGRGEAIIAAVNAVIAGHR
jgi:hypothetical protein